MPSVVGSRMAQVAIIMETLPPVILSGPVHDVLTTVWVFLRIPGQQSRPIVRAGWDADTTRNP